MKIIFLHFIVGEITVFLCIEQSDIEFATSLKEIKEKAPDCLGVASELFDDSQAFLLKVIADVQEASTCISPLYRIRTYSNNMKVTGWRME